MYNLSVDLGGTEYKVFGIGLKLKRGAGPMIKINLGNQPIELATQNTLTNTKERATLTGDSELEFQILGFSTQPAQYTQTTHMQIKAEQLEVNGLVLSKELMQWCEQTPTVEEGKTICLYQRGKASEQPVFNFMSAMYGKHLASLTDSYHEEKLEYVFPQHTIMPRSAAMDHFDYINEITNYICSKYPAVRGWAAFDTQSESESFQLLTLDKNAGLSLDPKLWVAKPAPMTSRFITREWSGDCFELIAQVRAQDAVGLLKALTQNGKQATAVELSGSYLNSEDSGKLVMSPGTVEYDGVNYFCEYVEYALTDADIPEEGEEYNVDVKVGLTLAKETPPSTSFESTKITGNFDAWTDDQLDEANFIPGNDVNTSVLDDWVLMTDDGGDADPALPLVANVNSPAPVREEYSGFYANRLAGDRHTICLFPGKVPEAIGSRHIYDEVHEATDLTLNGTTAQINVTAKGTEAPDCEAIYATGGEKISVTTTPQFDVLETALVVAEEEVAILETGAKITAEEIDLVDGSATITADEVAILSDAVVASSSAVEVVGGDSKFEKGSSTIAGIGECAM